MEPRPPMTTMENMVMLMSAVNDPLLMPCCWTAKSEPANPAMPPEMAKDSNL